MIIDEKKEYLVQATVIEARHLTGKDSSGMSNPFVKIKCADLAVQTTEVLHETLTPVWNQSFTFSGLRLMEQEFQTAELSFEVYSKNRFLGNELIGKYSIGLSTLYKDANHEYFNVWLTLASPDDPDESQGYLLVDCFVIGSGDKPPVHSLNDKTNQDVADEDEDVNIDTMKFDELKAYQDKKQGIIILGKPSVARKSFQLSVYVFKAENLVDFGSMVGSGKCNAFISARAVGLVQRTKIVGNNSNPGYNQKMLFPCYFPFLNDKILLRIWNHQPRSADEFIANIPEFSVPNDYFNISKLISMGGRMPAKWINLYSIPPWERNNGFMNNFVKIRHPKEGTFFMGRVLLSFSLLPNEKPAFCVMPCNPFYVNK
jgi:hypothetical protein